MEKVKIRGLAHIFAVIFAVWGLAVSGKAVYDLFIGEPEANLYSAQPWTFITQEEWLRYGGFELAYGLSCLALAWGAKHYARRLPEVHLRPAEKSPISLFD